MKAATRQKEPSLLPIWKRNRNFFNTQYLRNWTIFYPLNMEYGRNFWLKDFIYHMYTHHKLFFKIPLYPKHVIFISEFDNFGKNPSLYDIKISLKFLNTHGGISKIFFLDQFLTIIFRPEMLKFHPYSILTGNNGQICHVC